MKKWLIGLLFLLLSLFAELADAQYVTLTGTLQASNGLPAPNYTISFVPSQWGFIAGTGVVVNTTTYCGTNPSGAVVGITNPLIATINTPAYTSGTLPAANYFVVYAWYTATSTVTQVSPESTAQLTTQGQLNVAPPPGPLPAGVTGMRVYIGTSSGSETLQGSTTGTNVYSQTVPLVTGSAQPASNTTICTQVANDAIWPVGTGYTVSMTDPSGNTLPGYPMMWQLLGPGNTINLSNGLPYYNGVVTFPVPILAAPQNHGQQSISGPLSLSGYNLLNVYQLGVGTGFPAWGIDVEGTGAQGVVNAKVGFLLNGAAGTSGQCIGSNGTYFGSIVNCGNYNQTIQGAGTGYPQEPILNFAAGFTVADDPTHTRTNVSLTATKVQISLPATTVNANTCSTPATVTLTGTTSTSTFSTAFATNPTAATGWGANGGLVVELWPDASPNTLDWSICNQSGSSITPTAIVLNVGLS